MEIAEDALQENQLPQHQPITGPHENEMEEIVPSGQTPHGPTAVHPKHRHAHHRPAHRSAGS